MIYNRYIAKFNFELGLTPSPPLPTRSATVHSRPEQLSSLDLTFSHDALMVDPAFAALEWALRVILALACVIHSILDLTDPFHGAKSSALQVEDSIPRWLLPAVGVLRVVAAVALFSNESLMVLGGLAYCSMLWCGAVYFHLCRQHHPAMVVPAGFFVVLVFAITAMRISFWMALVGQVACALGAVALGWMLVAPKQEGSRPYRIM